MPWSLGSGRQWQVECRWKLISLLTFSFLLLSVSSFVSSSTSKKKVGIRLLLEPRTGAGVGYQSPAGGGPPLHASLHGRKKRFTARSGLGLGGGQQRAGVIRSGIDYDWFIEWEESMMSEELEEVDESEEKRLMKPAVHQRLPKKVLGYRFESVLDLVQFEQQIREVFQDEEDVYLLESEAERVFIQKCPDGTFVKLTIPAEKSQQAYLKLVLSIRDHGGVKMADLLPKTPEEIQETLEHGRRVEVSRRAFLAYTLAIEKGQKGRFTSHGKIHNSDKRCPSAGLIFAVAARSCAALELLLECPEIDLWYRNWHTDHTALELAEELGYEHIQRILKKAMREKAMRKGRVSPQSEPSRSRRRHKKGRPEARG